jgi:hypothetical protein
MSDHQLNLCEACLKTEYEEFRHACVHESMERNHAWIDRYAIRARPRWDYEIDRGTLTFSGGEKAKVVADMVVVGSVHGKEWEWSWGNANIPERHRSSMKKVFDFGVVKEWRKLTTLFLGSDEFLGWELGAISAHVLQAQAVYRCPTGPDNFLYLAILQTKLIQ